LAELTKALKTSLGIQMVRPFAERLTLSRVVNINLPEDMRIITKKVDECVKTFKEVRRAPDLSAFDKHRQVIPNSFFNAICDQWDGKPRIKTKCPIEDEKGMFSLKTGDEVAVEGHVATEYAHIRVKVAEHFMVEGIRIDGK